MSSTVQHARAVIVGGGPAGIATAACLRRRGLDPVVLEKGDTVAPAWRRHYDRLHLHTTRRASGLPGRPMPADYPRYPSRNQVFDYLRHYARNEGVEIRIGAEVTRVRRRDGAWEIECADGARFAAPDVVIATGLNHDRLSSPLRRLTTGDVSEVGLPAPDSGPMEQLATRRKVPVLDVGTMAALRRGDILAHPGITAYTADGVVFADGSAESFDAVVLGTGYEPGVARFLETDASVLDDAGYPLVSGDATAEPGLYFCGFREASTGRLQRIGVEAERLAERIARR